MNIFETIHEYSRTAPERPAVIWKDQMLSYGQLEQYSDRLASCLLTRYGSGGQGSGIAVYGHKHPWMLVCFLACVKAGYAYCPIDVSVPKERVKKIIRVLHSDCYIALEPLDPEVSAEIEGKEMISFSAVREMITRECEISTSIVGRDQVYYMIFTSGSTGDPKGVMITRANLENFLDWSVTLGNTAEEKKGKVFLNQAPFSFDLSVMDLYTCLASGGTLWTLDKETQLDYRLLLESLGKSQASVFVSTPSFADVCLADPSFNMDLMPELKVFLFCGETLTTRTAKKLRQRFPDAVIMNTYGPTESTVAVSEVSVDDVLIEQNESLPVGRVKKGSLLRICDEEGKVLPDGEKGEIHILGNTVAAGYYQKEELTEKAFYETEIDGETVRGYRTGDEGCLRDGMLYYHGRMDLQIKMNGYRIEIEDIENNILRIDSIAQAAVVPNIRRGAIRSLTAYVTGSDHSINVKEELKRYLPHYMIPKKVIFLDQLPLTINGKVDRKKLGGGS